MLLKTGCVQYKDLRKQLCTFKPKCATDLTYFSHLSTWALHKIVILLMQRLIVDCKASVLYIFLERKYYIRYNYICILKTILLVGRQILNSRWFLLSTIQPYQWCLFILNITMSHVLVFHHDTNICAIFKLFSDRNIPIGSVFFLCRVRGRGFFYM